jgi:3,5-dioxohexanoate:acetyl-CoA acetone transferase
MLDRGLIQPPLFVQLIFGMLGGVGTDTEDLMHMKRTADRLFGGQYKFSILAAGRHQMRFGTIGAIMGGNVRVGLEDSIYLGRASSPARTPSRSPRCAGILEALSLEPATPDEARAWLGLKGADV